MSTADDELPHDPRQSGSHDAVAVDEPSVSLADLKTAKVHITSPEAVAIVQALCSSIFDSGDRIGPAELEARAVLLHANGTVTALTEGRRDPVGAVQSLG